MQTFVELWQDWDTGKKQLEQFYDQPIDEQIDNDGGVFGHIYGVFPVDTRRENTLQGSTGNTLVFWTMQNEPDSCAKFLAEYPTININHQNSTGMTLLMLAAARKERASLVEKLLQAGADPNLTDVDGKTALIHLFSNGYGRFYEDTYPLKNVQAVTKMLLDAGTDPNLCDIIGHSAVDYCCNSPTIIKLLYDAGAVINEPIELTTTCVNDINGPPSHKVIFYLLQRIKQLEDIIQYAPGEIGYQNAKAHFEELCDGSKQIGIE